MTTTSFPTPAASQGASWRFVCVLFGVAAALRLGMCLLLRDIHAGPAGPPHADDVQFNQYALSLAAGDGFRNHEGELTSFRAPGFPFFLAGLYICGADYALVRIIFCLLGAANAVLAYFLARELLKEGYAQAVGWLAALYLGNLTVSLDFISETLFIPLLTLGCWLMVRFLRRLDSDDRPAWGLLFLTGLTLGYATLVRPFSLLLLPFWGLLLCWCFRRDLARWMVAGLAFGVPFLAMIAPWTVRNYQVHGHVVLMTTNGGSTFLGGNNDVVYGTPRLWGYWVGTDTLPERPLIDAAPNEYEHDQVEWRLGKEWIASNPDKAIVLVLFKFASVWGRPPEFSIGASTLYGLRGALYYPLLALMFIGFWRCLRDAELRAPWWTALHLTIAATMVTVGIFCGLARFRDANVSLLMIYAVVGWATLRPPRAPSSEAMR